VNSPIPADVATSRGRFRRRSVPARRVASPMGRMTRSPTITSTKPDAMRIARPPTTWDRRAPPIVAGTPPSSDHPAARGLASRLRR